MELNMSEQSESRDAAQLLHSLRRHTLGRHRAVIPAELAPQLALLRAWQSARLSRTHADLLDSSRYGRAAAFFLRDIYAARDFSQRNEDIRRVYHSMRRVFPDRILHTLSLVIELHDFTVELDAALLRALVTDLGVTDTISAAQYGAAYRICNNYDDRVRQIELIVEVGRRVDRLVRLPLIGATLRLARGPARWAGWEDLQDFLERGYAAFKHLGGADAFLEIIQRRERLILDRLFAAAADPFAIDA
jgi:hypothetical protein